MTYADEAHHSSNNIYTKVINYFNPKLFLGMTATPDKRDDNQEGKNIYEIFHYQIAHEIRSQQAMEDNLRTIALSGADNEEKRQEAFERLAMDEADATEEMQPLDYIFSRDILNEGVDIVEVNQVIMLRPTQSPIVFIQQLGRGLRKAPGKEYVVILDFIGNYNNNFMIPVALSGDRSYNADVIRKYVISGNSTIPGATRTFRE